VPNVAADGFETPVRLGFKQFEGDSSRILKTVDKTVKGLDRLSKPIKADIRQFSQDIKGAVGKVEKLEKGIDKLGKGRTRKPLISKTKRDNLKGLSDGIDKVGLKASNLVRKQNLVNSVMRQTGVSAQVAGRAVSVYAGNLDRAEKEAVQLARGLGKAKNETNRLTEAQKRGNKTTSKGSNQLLEMGKRAAGLALAYVGVRQGLAQIGQSTDVFLQLEDNLLGTQAVTNSTSEEMKGLSDQTRELGRSTRFTAIEVAKTQQILSRAGFSMRETVGALPSLLNFASAAQLDLNSATSIGADILRSFNRDVRELENVLDILAFAANRANTDVRLLSQGAKFAAPVFQATGQGVDVMSAALATLADRGLKGELGGTGLRISIRSLIAPTKIATETLKKMGINLEDVDFQGENLIDVINLLAEKNLGAAESFRIFSARGGTSMLALTAGVDKFNEIYTEMGEGVDGTTKRMSETIESGLGGSTRRLVSAVESARIAFSEGYVPALMESQKRTIELLNTSEDTLISLGKLAGGVLNITSAWLNFITGTSLVKGLSSNIDEITASTVKMQEQWGLTSKAIAGGAETIDERLKVVHEQLKRNIAQAKLFGSQTPEQKRRLGDKPLEAQRQIFALRTEIEALEAAQDGANIAAIEAAEIADEQAKAFAREEKEAKSVALGVEAVSKAKQDAKVITRGLRSEIEKLEIKLGKAKNALDLGVLSLGSYNKEVERLNGLIHDIEVDKLAQEIEELKGLLELTRPEMVIEAKVETKEIDALEKRLDKELTLRIVTSIGTPGIPDLDSGSGEPLDIFNPADDIEGIKQFGKEYKNQLTKAQKITEKFEGQWGNVADAIFLAGDAISSMDSGLGGLLKSVSSLIPAFENLAKARASGDQVAINNANAQLADAVLGAVGTAAGGALAGGGTSSFGGEKSGTFSEEGASIGGIFGGTGAFVGAVLGAFFKKAGDTMVLQFSQGLDNIESRVQASEGLEEIAGFIADQFAGLFNTLEDELGLTVFEGLQGLEITIENELATVRIGGAVKGFRGIDSLSQAMAFAAERLLSMNENAEGLGDNVRQVFERIGGPSEVGDFEELSGALNLAIAMDRLNDGLDITRSTTELFFDNLQDKTEENLELQGKFNLVAEDVLALTDRAIEQKRKELGLGRDTLFGASNIAQGFADLAREMEGFNTGIDKELKFRENLTSNREGYIEGVIEETVAIERLSEGISNISGATTEAADAVDQAMSDIVRQGFKDRLETISEGRGDLSIDSKVDSMEAGFDKTIEALQDALRLDVARDQAEALGLSLEEIPEKFSAEDIADVFRKGAAQAGTSLITLLQQVKGEQFGIAKLQEAAAIEYKLQLAAQIRETQRFLEIADDASKSFLRGILNEANSLLGDLESGEVKFTSQKPGRGKGKQRREEARREAEKAAEQLEEFNLNLSQLTLNASTASGTLGDLSSRLLDIVTIGQEALDIGASAEDVRRQQGLSIRGERQELLSPFREAAGSNFLTESVDIEQQRQDALEKAKLIAQTQADLLGVPFEVAFASMELVINRGSKQMQNALTRAMVSSLGLPLEKVRDGLKAFRLRMKDLHLAFKTGAISERRYLDLLQQIQTQQDQAVGSEALGLADKYYKGVIDGEELRRTLAIANFDLELSQAELRFNRLLLEGALSQEIIESVSGMLQFMRDNPPDWDAFFTGGPSDKLGVGSRISSTGPTAVTIVEDNFKSLIDSINGFLSQFDRVDIGRFETQAKDWIDAIGGFNQDIDAALTDNTALISSLGVLSNSVFGISDITQLTSEQLDELSALFPTLSPLAHELIALIRLEQELDAISGQASGKILDLYEGTLEVTNQLAQEYQNINNEFADVIAALDILGGTAEELARAEEIRLERIAAFWELALSGVRGLSEELRGGSLGGISARRRVDVAEDRVDELRARLEVDP